MLLWSENRQKKMQENREKEWNSESMWLTCVSQLQPLWICIQSGTWKTQQRRQTMDRWLIRCVRLLSEKVRAEIKCQIEHPIGVYWKGAGMQRMSAVWVCPWMKSAHKMHPRQPLKQFLFQGTDAGNPHLSVYIYRLNEKKYPLHVWSATHT